MLNHPASLEIHFCLVSAKSQDSGVLAGSRGVGGSSQVGFGSAAYKAPLGARTFKKSNFYTAFIPERLK